MQVIYIDRLGNIWQETRESAETKESSNFVCLTSSPLSPIKVVGRAKEYYDMLKAPKTLIRQKRATMFQEEEILAIDTK